MAIEIERKFLVKGNSWRSWEGRAVAGINYRQGYILSGTGRTVRVRIAGSQGYLTIKSPTQGISRAEFEYAIPVTDAAEMLETLCDRPLIEKTRYTLPWAGVVWEIDEFAGENQGLILAEVELTDPNQVIQYPDWVGIEVSGDPRYFNSYLVQHPFREWGTSE